MNRHLIVFFCSACLLVFGGAAAWPDDARRKMKLGLQEYKAGDFEAAQREFEDAAKGASDERLDAGAALYNEANALYRLGQPDRAASKYMDAGRSTDLSLQKKTFFNRGNALYQLAEQAQAEGDLDSARQALEQAMVMYENTMALDPADRDSKINYELTLRKHEEVKELQEQQQQQQEQQQGEQEQEQEKKDDEQEPEEQQEEEQESSGQQQEPAESGEQQQQPQPQQEQSAEEMTEEEARVLLDAMRQEEQAAREQYRMVQGTPAPVDKDW
ncbi:MAG: Tetratricopeptide repeat protein [Verrucomicrobia bacterium ADurb.Bin345]|nr:MAG: Tetratricopeptide repeat protein [Verrucomicrobia bacterium ADurb.Bin345]